MATQQESAISLRTLGSILSRKGRQKDPLEKHKVVLLYLYVAKRDMFVASDTLQKSFFGNTNNRRVRFIHDFEKKGIITIEKRGRYITGVRLCYEWYVDAKKILEGEELELHDEEISTISQLQFIQIGKTNKFRCFCGTVRSMGSNPFKIYNQGFALPFTCEKCRQKVNVKKPDDSTSLKFPAAGDEQHQDEIPDSAILDRGIVDCIKVAKSRV